MRRFTCLYCLSLLVPLPDCCRTLYVCSTASEHPTFPCEFVLNGLDRLVPHNREFDAPLYESA